MSTPAMEQRHWSAHKERGNFALMWLTALGLRLLGRKVLTPLIYVVVLYFFASARAARNNIRQYQTYLAAWSGQPALRPTTRRIFQQFMGFAETLLDRLDAWRGRLKLEHIQLVDPTGIRAQLLQSQHGGRGQILVGTHLGNLDVCRAMAELGEQVPLNVLVHTRHVAHFNKIVSAAGDRSMRLIQVSELDTAVMMDLSQRIERGEWLAIAGDRVPLNDGRRVIVNFLGHEAAFPQGPWLLAGLLRCRVNLMCCIKVEGRYRIILEPFLEDTTLVRSHREATIKIWVQRYADRLAQLCLMAPLQWYNFYPYWPSPAKEDTDAH